MADILPSELVILYQDAFAYFDEGGIHKTMKPHFLKLFEYLFPPRVLTLPLTYTKVDIRQAFPSVLLP